MNPHTTQPTSGGFPPVSRLKDILARRKAFRLAAEACRTARPPLSSPPTNSDIDKRKSLAVAARACEDSQTPLPELTLTRSSLYVAVEEQATGPLVSFTGPLQADKPILLGLDDMDELVRWWAAMRPEALVRPIAEVKP